MATHQKHALLTKPNYGEFTRNEWAIIGTPCGNIQRLANALIKQLSSSYKVVYIDADHGVDDASKDDNALSNGATIAYIDKITHHRFNIKSNFNTYQFRSFFNEQDIALVNGNHYKAKKQIVVIDPKKEKSLQKKLDRLTDVQLFLSLEENKIAFPEYLKSHLPNWKTIPIINISDETAIADFIKKDFYQQIPPLNGLVLAGGKSQRMGQDKGVIEYHGKAQRIYVADILSNYCEHTFLSVRKGQVAADSEKYPIIEDRIAELGPMGAIISAFLKYPNHAWLVVACDLPLLDKNTIHQLVTQRSISSVATAFRSPFNEFPEPLITIWEPKSYPILLQFLAQGYSCPRKVLINSNTHLIEALDSTKLMNVNTPNELITAKQIIESR